MKYFKIVFIIILMTFITGCTNIFQKNVVITNTDKIENNNIDNNIENSIIEEDVINEDEIIINDNDSNFKSEEELITYFSNIEEENNKLLLMDRIEQVKDTITNSFVTIIDFIFYDKEIKGVKFKSLRNETKLKILEIADRMDNSIESKFPNYKDDIKSTSTKTYNKITDKLKSAKEYLNEKTKDVIGEENYNNLQENYQSLKESVKNVGEKIKEGSSQVKNKIKNWYEEKTGK